MNLLRMAASAVALGSMLQPGFAIGSERVTIDRSFPVENVETEVEVGQAMLTREQMVASPTIRLGQQIISASALGNKIVLPAGDYILVARTEKGSYYQSQSGVVLRSLGISTTWPKGGIFLSPGPDSTASAYWENDFGMRARGALDHPQVSEVPTNELSGTGFRSQLIYAGTTKGAISITYREFKNEFARPAFSTDLTYDLSEGEEVGFRGARIRVLSATNTTIRYVVIKPMTLPQ